MEMVDPVRLAAYQDNLKNFNEIDRAAARTALGIYKFEIDGAGFRQEFNFTPRHINEQLRCLHGHHEQLGRLRQRAGEFDRFIRLLERFPGRPVVDIFQTAWFGAKGRALFTRTLEDLALPAYRCFHDAITAYLTELGKAERDWPALEGLARDVAHHVNPHRWREDAITRSISSFNTRLYLEAILIDPSPSD